MKQEIDCWGEFRARDCACRPRAHRDMCANYEPRVEQLRVQPLLALQAALEFSQANLHAH